MQIRPIAQWKRPSEVVSLHLIVMAVLFLAADQVAAGPITLSTSAEHLRDGISQVFDSDTSLGASIVSRVEARFTFGFAIDSSGYPYAQSRAASDGSISTRADGHLADGLFLHELRAEATYSEDFLGSGGPLAYDFFIPRTELYIWNNGGYAFDVGYEMSINLIQGAISTALFTSAASLSGHVLDGSTLVKTGTDLGGTLFCLQSCSPRENEFGYEFAPYSDTLPLGTFAPGEPFTLEVQIATVVVANGAEAGGAASIGDPGDVDGPRFGGSVIGLSTPVPEPRSLFLLGVGVLAATRSTRRRGRC